MDQKRANEYEAILAKLRFAIADALTLDAVADDIGATFVKAKPEDERIYIAFRPHDRTSFLTRLALNPAAAFDLANAILAAGGNAGWYEITSVDGQPVPKIRH
jgi:hypothetical protein